MNILPKIPLVFAILLLLSTQLFAQTEFEGDISGEWTVEGSPYVQVGEANVPEDESLTIQPGVEVILGEDMTLTCNGLLTAIGTEEDSIRFHGPEGIVSGALVIETDEDTVRFQYCRFDSLEDGIWSENWALSVENCRFVDNHYHLDVESRWVYVTNNYFVGSDEGRGAGMFRFGSLNYEEGTYAILNNEFQGRTTIGITVENAEVIGNTAIPNARDRFPTLFFSNCRTVVCNNNTGWFSIRIGNDFRRLEQAIFEDNDAWTIGVHDQADWGVVVRNNRIRAECSLGCARAEYYDNIFGRARQFQSSIYVHGSAWPAVAIFERNLLNGVRIRDNSDVYMRNNTIWGGVTEYISGAESSSMTLINNIFAYFDMEGFLIDPAIGEITGGYNCFWGEEQPYGEERDLLEGDIVQDPLMRGGIPYDFRLRADSPCLDTGDPDSPEDPDGTRADIGCYPFDQENGEQPSLDRHWDYYIGWDETFRYAAKAVDEGEELQISFEGLPEWLEIEEDDGRRDFVRDSVVVSGVVPEDQEDFVFQVLVRDDADREDTLSVRVMVYPYRVLTGVVRGVLDIEQSPFIVADTAWIPAGDSLVLPPGTELFFDNRNDSLAGRSRSMLMVEGIIKAVGVEGDSVYLEALDFDGGRSHFYFADNAEGLNEFEYCRITHVGFRNTVLGADISVSHSLGSEGVSNELQVNGFRQPIHIHDNKGNLRIVCRGRAEVESNEMRHLVINRGDSVLVHDNILIGLTTINDTRAIIYNNQDLDGISIFGGGPQHLDWVVARNNYFSDKVYVLNPPAEITNNIIDSQGARGIYLNPSEHESTIANNVIAGASVALEFRLYRDIEQARRNINIRNNVILSADTLLLSYRDLAVGNGIGNNSIFDCALLPADSIYSTRLTQVNANEDSVDANFNLYLDPRLAGPDTLDFRLYVDSPLINAGDPDAVFNDVDSTVNDIGLFGGPYGMEYEYLDPNEVISFVSPPVEYEVGQVYPNPFNSNAAISIEIPRQGEVTFLLYDIQGRRLAHNVVLLSAGLNRQSLSSFLMQDLSRLNSGVFILTTVYEKKRINRRMVLVR